MFSAPKTTLRSVRLAQGARSHGLFNLRLCLPCAYLHGNQGRQGGGRFRIGSPGSSVAGFDELPRKCSRTARELPRDSLEMSRTCPGHLCKQFQTHPGNFRALPVNIPGIVGEMFRKVPGNVQEMSRTFLGHVFGITRKCPGNGQDISWTLSSIYLIFPEHVFFLLICPFLLCFLGSEQTGQELKFQGDNGPEQTGQNSCKIK